MNRFIESPRNREAIHIRLVVFTQVRRETGKE
jgi:hypothetical protein